MPVSLRFSYVKALVSICSTGEVIGSLSRVGLVHLGKKPRVKLLITFRTIFKSQTPDRAEIPYIIVYEVWRGFQTLNRLLPTVPNTDLTADKKLNRDDLR